MSAILIKKTTNHFVDQSGRVFKIENGKEIDISARQSKKTKRYNIYIDGKQYDYLNLMLQYFAPEIKATDKIQYTVNKFNRIEANSIRIKPFISSELSNEDELKMHEYGCSLKASSANQRCVDQITPLQVLMTLKIHDYKCIYCISPIHPKNWHLDHYVPISKTGKNKFENIVPSCPTCNKMKHAMHGEEFYMQCIRIVNNFIFKPNE